MLAYVLSCNSTGEVEMISASYIEEGVYVKSMASLGAGSKDVAKLLSISPTLKAVA